MYLMVVLLLGSLVVGLSRRLSATGQTRLALVAAVAVTVIYFASARAM